MRSLFIRIFFWFWLVMAIVVGLLVLSSPWWTRARPAVLEWERRVFTMMGRELDRVAEVVTAEGWEGARRMAEGGWARGQRHGRRMRDHLWIANGDGELHGAAQATDEAVELAHRARRSGEAELRREGTRFLMALPITDADGHAMVAVLSSARGFRRHHPMEPPPSPIGILQLGLLLPRLAIVFIVVGALCYWLSRYLTSPVTALRAAARGLADGDLSVRVEPPVARRKDEIGELARDFDTMAERLERLVSSQQRLIRDVSHELRSPLARLNVALELARSRDQGADRRWMDRIETEAQRLDHLIGQQLVLARLEAGDDESSRTEIRLDQLVSEIVVDAGIEAAAAGCTVDLVETVCKWIDGNADLLRSALDNVLRNAIRFSAEQTVVEVRLWSPEGSGEARISVRDHGPGVPESMLEDLFEPFFRVEEARDRRQGGAGLGLAIAARAVRLHDGSIFARNARGGGLLVEIVLPGVRDPRTGGALPEQGQTE